MEEVIRNHGLKVLFVARFLVGVRSAIYLAAGALHVPFRRFFVVDLISATSVVGLFFFASYRYGATISGWLRQAQFLLTLAALLAVIALAVSLWQRHRKKVRDRLNRS